MLDAADAEAFLQPSVDNLHDGRLLAGMAEALALLLDARAAKQPVAIVGDYDVDGITGTAILTAVLRARGLKVEPILPHRLRDGYGFQPVHVERAIAAGCALIITVDCGTTSLPAVQAALDAGLGVIVTDHHLPQEPLPESAIQINPKQESCSYPFDELSGAGLAFKLALSFAEACAKPIDPGLLLRVACLGTIADLVPLRGENRVIAWLGLRELAHSSSTGLTALIEVARMKPPYSASDVGFKLGPRLNAPGRIGSADQALELLLTRDASRASQLAADLDAANRERRAWEKRATDEAIEWFDGVDPLPAILVAASPDWHRGVVGIAAGRLARRFNRPTILLSIDGDQATGSGRSIEGIHLFDFLDRWRDRLPRFGGHAQAIGLTVDVETLDELHDAWRLAAGEEWAERVAERRYRYEIELPVGELNHQVLESLQQLEPFGMGNRQPTVRVPGPLRLAAPIREFGTGHLEAEMIDDNRDRIRLVGWNWQHQAQRLHGDVECLGHLELDHYRGGVRLRLIDCRATKSGSWS